MTLLEFLDSHDKAILAIERLKNILEDEGFKGALEDVADIERHLKSAEFEYLGYIQYLTEED